MNRNWFVSGSTITLLSLLLTVHQGMAAEGVSPLQPGATTGAPAGALPPSGLYLVMDTDYEAGKLKNNQGHTAVTPAGQKIKASNFSSVVALTWVTDYQLLGARYAMAIAQPYKWARTKTSSDSGNSTTTSQGNINTSLTPMILSWGLQDNYFLATGLTVYIDNGDFSHTYDSSEERNIKSSKAIGNHYWTFEPSIAVTKMDGPWTYTLNNLMDFNTENKTTHYRSGMTYYLDASAIRKINQYSIGVIGNYTKQISDDKVKGKSISAVDGFSGEGNRSEHILAGALLGYDFGSFSLNSRILMSLRAKNDADISFFHIGINYPIR